MQDKTICILLAGGEGSRLSPLTADRAKPAVPFGGRYRIIDFTLSNCLHSGLRRILVLTQYKSHSLQKHLRDGWSIFNPELKEYITPVPPQMRTGKSWYVGTADAIYQNLYLLERSGAELVLILSGDHIYRMDYAAMLEFHVSKGSDVTIASMEVPRKDARAFGVLDVDENDRVLDFKEKLLNPPSLPNKPDASLASMGIYVFSLDLLADCLKTMRASGGTNMAAAIKAAIAAFENVKSERVIVIATDGQPDKVGAALDAGKAAKKEGIDIIAIGTDDADQGFLKKLASRADLGRKVTSEKFAQSIVDSAQLLPPPRTIVKT